MGEIGEAVIGDEPVNTVQASSKSDSDLITAMRCGDRAALSLLVARHGRALIAYAMSKLDQQEDAEDIVQETLVVAWKRAASIRIHADSALPWLLAVCRNKCLHRLRERGRLLSVSTDEIVLVSTHDVEASAVTSEYVRALTRAVETLSDVDQMIYRLCIVDGLSYDHAARQLGLSNGSIRNRISRLRLRLRQELAILKG